MAKVFIYDTSCKDKSNIQNTAHILRLPLNSSIEVPWGWRLEPSQTHQYCNWSGSRLQGSWGKAEKTGWRKCCSAKFQAKLSRWKVWISLQKSKLEPLLDSPCLKLITTCQIVSTKNIASIHSATFQHFYWERERERTYDLSIWPSQMLCPFSVSLSLSIITLNIQYSQM